MARRQKSAIDLQDIDTSNTDPKYWEAILNACDLHADKGLSHKVIAVGGSKDLVKIEEGSEVKAGPSARFGTVVPPHAVNSALRKK